jgi:hypothetical protein
MPLRHTVGELRKRESGGACEENPSESKTQQRFGNLVAAARYLEGKEPGCHGNPSAALTEPSTGPGLNAEWRTKGQ